ncbi:hypothetical protein KQY27_04975 [Methanobrevibacter sp. TMH8]|uniref:hypothetical protein n=1 Tax=Methanobrevibacter sp. TMH8 TaxID=2848611 RepID=UPI001CCB0C3B|nr:hypothetical protein [Methanobrevibacter sp. TMH8]MBZ9570896.1 hypothetical protein [Methanobrevibacter sp. TMH8]
MNIEKQIENFTKIKENIIDDVSTNIESSNPNIAIFKRIPDENYFYPYNKAALNYSLEVINKNLKKIKSKVEFKFLEKQEKDLLISDFYQLIDNFKKINIKNKGKINIDSNIMVFQLSNGKLNPLNENSKLNLYNIYDLMSNTPNTNKILWKKLKIV